MCVCVVVVVVVGGGVLINLVFPHKLNFIFDFQHKQQVRYHNHFFKLENTWLDKHTNTAYRRHKLGAFPTLCRKYCITTNIM